MKQTLAITTKVPTFASPLHVGRPNLGDRNALLARITDILDRRWLSNDGPLVKEFEQRIAEYVGVKHCIAMCNATVALEIAIRALDLRGEVIVPSYTFIATAHVLQWQGITPVFADMDPQTHNIDPECIEWLITPHTTGIIGVHVWGRACDTEAIEAVGREHGLKVMYDAAHAFGCSHRGQMIGGFGACEVFSFHATKFLNSFEGGALVTNDDVLTDKSRLMRNFGFAGYDRVIYLGINGKMTEVCAAMGLTSLEGIDELIATNRKNYEAYRKGLADLVGLRVIDYDPEERSNYQYIVVEINPDRAPLNRDELIDVLHAENVLARKYFWPGCHRMEPYRSLQANAPLLLPQTERIADRVLVLPTGMSITCEDIERVCAIIRTAAEHREEVRNALRGR
ncbi:MAG: dTDP-4-dehydro-6-deoxyglucose aminotransferase [Verrucomicrobia bacterium]|nr:MAG: dTDP-4-dehydro-6-deoxyglucose aminotransferase [Verrucomicrobiota bacterium]